jgi:hypothetical protein
MNNKIVKIFIIVLLVFICFISYSKSDDIENENIIFAGEICNFEFGFIPGVVVRLFDNQYTNVKKDAVVRVSKELLKYAKVGDRVWIITKKDDKNGVFYLETKSGIRFVIYTLRMW